MLTLAAADYIAGVADAAAQLTLTLFGMELNAGVEAYKSLFQGQLPNAAASQYAAPANTQSFVRSVTIVNTDAANSHWFKLFRGGTAAANQITSQVTIPAGGFALYEDGLGWQVFNASGQLLQSQYPTVSPLDIWGITGAKAETMDRNTCPEVNTTVATTGQIVCQAIWLTAGTVVNNITMASATTAASVPTHYCFALYNSSLSLLASSADQTSTAWAANTVKTLAMGAAYTVPTTGLYYIAFMMVATTVPTMKGGTARTDGTLSFSAPAITGVSSTAYSTGTAPAGPLGALAAKVTFSLWGCVS